MNTKKTLLLALPLLTLVSLFFTMLLQGALENRKQVGWSDVSLKGMRIEAIVFDAQDRVWVSSKNGNIQVFDGDSWTAYPVDGNGLSLSWVNNLATDAQGRVWIATPNGLSVFDGGGWTTHTEEEAKANDKIAFDRQGRTWLYQSTSGLSVFDGQTWTTYTTDNSGLVSDKVTVVAFDRQNRAWIGTRDGLSVFDGQTWTTYTAENSGLAYNHIFTLVFDEQDRAWIGAEGALNVFNGQTWASYSIDRKPVSGSMYGGPYVIVFDEQNKAWVGIHDGLNVLDIASGEVVLRDRAYTVGDVLFDAQGQVWLTPFSYSKGLRMFSDGRWLEYTAENSALPHPTVTALAIDHEGRIWIGTRSGLSVIHPAEARPISTGSALLSQFLANGGHAFLPIILIGLWLGIWLDALRGVITGLAVGLTVALGSFLTASGGLFILAAVVMVTGIIGGLVGSRVFGRASASPTSPEEAASSPRPSDMGGILGGGLSALGCVATVFIVGGTLLVVFLLLVRWFGIGMQ